MTTTSTDSPDLSRLRGRARARRGRDRDGPGDGPRAVTAGLDEMVAAVEPWRTGGDYLNFADRPSDASGAFDEQTYRRLREVKGAVNPTGLFAAAHPVV